MIIFLTISNAFAIPLAMTSASQYIPAPTVRSIQHFSADSRTFAHGQRAEELPGSVPSILADVSPSRGVFFHLTSFNYPVHSFFHFSQTNLTVSILDNTLLHIIALRAGCCLYRSRICRPGRSSATSIRPELPIELPASLHLASGSRDPAGRG